ncbi:MAG TPA: hypothetical protein DCS93_18780 [Microscillaceae bacterium]|nr:hypothetical protein [Microscillaceae bacterium]
MKKVMYTRIFLIILFLGFFVGNLLAQKRYKLDIIESRGSNSCSCGTPPSLLTINLKNGSSTNTYCSQLSPSSCSQTFSESQKPVSVSVIAIEHPCRPTAPVNYNLTECQPVLTLTSGFACYSASFGIALFSTPDPITTSKTSYCESETVTLTTTNACLSTFGVGKELRWEVSTNGTNYSFLKTSMTDNITTTFSEIPGASYGNPVYFRVRYTDHADLGYSSVRAITFNRNPPVIPNSGIAGTSPICTGGLGQIQITATNSGSGAYRYDLEKRNGSIWEIQANKVFFSPPSASSPVLFEDLAAGEYRVRVLNQDGNNCQPSYSTRINIIDPPALQLSVPACTDCSVTSTTSNPPVFTSQCNGNTANLQFAIQNGIAPYRYRTYLKNTTPVSFPGTSNVTGNSFALDLAVGTYVVEVTDINDCPIATQEVVIEEPDPISVAIATVVKPNGKNTSCFGANDGEITVTVNGGVQNFDLALYRGGVQEGATQTGIAKGVAVSFMGLQGGASDYTIRVSEPGGCGTDAKIETVPVITQPDAVSAIIQSVKKANGYDFSCATSAKNFVPDGVLEVTPQGGSGPFDIYLNDGTSDVQSITNIDQGNTHQFTGLAVGTNYSIRIVEPSGCGASNAYIQNFGTLQPPPTPTIAVNAPLKTNGLNISCTNGNDGTIEVTLTGGVATHYNIALNSGDTQNNVAAGSTATFENLSPGNYVITVTETGTDGCEFDTNITLTAPSETIGATITLGAYQPNGVAHISCAGGSDGSFTVTPKGGGNGAPYTVETTKPGFSKTEANVSANQPVVFTGLAAGVYTVTITDNAGCVATFTKTSGGQVIELTEPDAIAATFHTTPITCFGGANGQAVLTIGGGNNYSPSGITLIDLNDGGKTLPAPTQTQANEFTWTGLEVGEYRVTITDSKGCQLQDAAPWTNSQFSIVQPSQALAIQIVTQTDITCNGLTDGTIEVEGTGGWGSYLYSLDGINFTSIPAADHLFENLSVGNYTVWVKDNLGCTASVMVNLSEPSALVVTPVTTLVSCHGENDGSVTLNATGGNGNYTYSMQPNSGFTANATFTTLSPGRYTFYVRSNGTCREEVEVTIIEPAELTASVDASQTQHITCNGANDGAVTLNILGGTAPYKIAANGGAFTSGNTIGGLLPGNNSLRIEDAKGCFVNLTDVNINEPAALQLTLVQKKETACATAKGSAEVVASGGTGAYAYAWYNDQNTLISSAATATGLSTGTYRVEVKDANNCIASALNVTIGTVALPDIQLINRTPASCSAISDGTATIQIVGGVAPVTVQWDNNQTTLTATGLSVGMHTVTLTDADGCATVKQVEILEAPAMVIQAIAQVNPSCKGAATGSISVSVASGGKAPFSYSWNTGATGSSITNLSAGTYIVTVIDDNGCTQSQSFTLTEPAVALTLNEIGNTPATCFGASDGAVQVQGAGGGGGYLYSKDGSTFQASNTFSGLAAGSHDLWVKDALGCEVKLTVTITEPSQVVPTIVSINQVTCNGGNDGSVTLGANGGEGDYTYSTQANSGFTTNATFTTLSAGDYTYYVRSKDQCTTPINFTITEPTVLTASIAQIQHIICNGANNGSVTLNISGGTTPYKIAANGGAFTSGNTISGLMPGNNSLRVEDANGCFVNVANVTINEPAVLQVTLVQKQETGCATAKGSAEVVASGGTGAYTYTWYNVANNGFLGTGATINNLVVGSYRVEVVDANTCFASLVVNISSLGAPQMQLVSTTPASCTAAADGSATIQIVSGVAPVTILWDNGQTSLTATGLTPGDHNVTLTDKDGCQTVEKVMIPLGTQMMIRTVNQTNPLCFGDNNGSLSVQVNNGKAPYAYAWNTGATGSTINNLNAGVYTVTVTDANGCTQSESFTLSNPTQLAIAIKENTSPDCFNGTNGRIEIEASGGTGAYTYTWAHDASATSAVLANIGAGVYEVTVRDANGCTLTQSVRVDETPEMTTSVVKTLPSCGSAGDGQIIANASGGAGGYTYSWTATGSSTVLSATNTLSSINAGSYDLTITDSKGCNKTQTFTLDNPIQISLVTLTNTDPTCHGGNNGVLSVQAQGGMAPYTYQWDNGQTGGEATNLTAGTHQVTVRDANGCAKTFDLLLNEPAELVLQLMQKTETACELGKGAVEVSASGGAGALTYFWYDASNNFIGSGTTIQNLNQGAYTAKVQDAQGCETSLQVNINALPLPQINVVTIAGTSCATANDGTATIEITSGSAPFTILWDNGQTSLTANGLTVGKHDVTVTDKDGCSVVQAVTIPETPSLSVTGTPINPTCFGGSNGSINLNISGGTTPFTYAWNTGASSSQLTDLTAGSYTVTVTDANGCSQTQSYQLITPNALDIAITENKMPTCFNACDGQVTVSVNGGTAPYTYQWSHEAAQRNATITGACAGVYTVTVTDANGCVAVKNIRVSDPSDFLINIQAESPKCHNATDGKLTASVTGGVAPYAYQWAAPGQTGISTTATLSNVKAGAYTLTVTDANGCSQTNTYVLDNPALLSLSLVTAASKDPSCNGGNDGVLQVQAQGGVTPYTYAWKNGQTGQTATGLTAGTYAVEVTDANGCTQTASYELFDPTPVALSLPAIITLCPGQTYQVKLDNVGSQYTWTKNGEFFSNERAAVISEAGTYALTATTFGGCIVTAETEVVVSSDALDASFLLVDEAVIEDTVVAIEFSFPAPEQIRWTVSGTDEERTILSDQGFYEHQMIFHKAGIYQVTLYTTSGNCQDSVSQNIEIFETEQEAQGGRNVLGNQPTTKVQHALAYPNPTSGTFKVHVQLSEPGDASVSIRNSYSIAPLSTQLKTGEDKYTFVFDLQNLKYRVYFAVIQTKDETKVLKILVN